MRDLASPRGRNVLFWHVLAHSRGQMARFGVSQRAKCARLARLGAFQEADGAIWPLPQGEMCTFGTSWRIPEGRWRDLASPRARKVHVWYVLAHCRITTARFCV